MSKKSENPVIARLRTDAANSRREAVRLQSFIDAELVTLGDLRARHQAHVRFADNAEQAIRDIEAVERRRRLYGQEVVQ